MNLGEFKAWLAGYLESCSVSPAKRVKRIEEQLATVRENPVGVPYPVRSVPYIPYEWTRPIVTWDNVSTDATDWKFSTNRIICNDVTGDTTTTIAYLNAGGVE